MLASGADVKLGSSYEFELDESVEDHYRHEIVTLDQQRRIWQITDWSGGEGHPWFDPQNPDSYYVSNGGVNPRWPGELFAKPSTASVTLSSSNSATPYTAIGMGYVWVAAGTETYYSSDGVSWNAGPTLAAGHVIHAITGTADYVYVSSLNAGTRYVYQCTTAGKTEVCNQASQKKFLGLVYWLDGKLYAWTGRKIYSFDVNETYPLVLDATPGFRKVFDNGADLASGTYYGGIVADAGVLFFFLAFLGKTSVWQRTANGKTTLIWNPGDLGFTGQTISSKSGNLVIGGHYGTTTGTGRGAVHALNIATREPFLVTKIRPDSENAHVVASCPSYDSQMLLSTDNNKVYVYDFDTSALTELDESANTINSLITFGLKRIAAHTLSTTLAITYWKDDDPANRGGTLSTLDSPNWDFALPFETKELVGVYVAFVPLNANQSITVGYQLDDSGSFTSLTAITSATSGNATGRVFIPVSSSSSTLSFWKMKVRVQGTTSSGLSPIVHALAVEAKSLSYEETWQLALKLREEKGEDRPQGRAYKAEQVRDFLEAIAKAKALITYLDGFRYEGVNAHDSSAGTSGKGYSTHTVTVEGISDSIARNAEGTWIVRLKAVPV